MVERIFATRTQKKIIRVTEVMRDATGGSSRIVKNLIYSPCGGYSAVYEKKPVIRRSRGYAYEVMSADQFDVWTSVDCRIGFSYRVLNPEYIATVEEFKYSGYSGGGAIQYLNAYRKDKSVEFFGKMGLNLSPVLMKKAKKDGKFRRFLFENHNAIALYGVQAALYSYSHGVSVEEARRICFVKNQLDRLVSYRIPAIKGTKLDRQRVLDYVDFGDINYASYNDYLTALKELRYDLNDTKNVYPHDFKTMHDLRIAEYASFKEKEDRKKRAKFYRDFRKKGQSLRTYELKGEKYSLIVPQDISDLKREGTVLEHCVGTMGYDKKVVDGVSIIMFCRKNDNLDEPYVTVEYRLDRKALNQCYGYKDSKPTAEVLAFVNEWALKLTQTLQAVQ
jgi:hypothetical protein